MKVLKLKLLLIIVISVIIYPCFAFSTTIGSISSFAVTSQGMNGMGVTVTLSDGTTESGIWNTINSMTSGVSGTDWSFINEAYSTSYDDTMNNFWTLSNSSNFGIKSITINAIQAGIVFDIINSLELTSGSKQGWWDGNGSYGTANSGTELNSNSTVHWTFSDEISLAANPSTYMEDTWGILNLSFTTPFTSASSPLKFQLDTDSVVPEPTTLLLFGLGLLSVGVMGKKHVSNNRCESSC